MLCINTTISIPADSWTPSTIHLFTAEQQQYNTVTCGSFLKLMITYGVRNCLFCFFIALEPRWLCNSLIDFATRSISLSLSLSLSLALCLSYSLIFLLSYLLNTVKITTYNTSFSMHVMALAINLIDTFSFYVGQMSGNKSVHSINVLIWATFFSLSPIFFLFSSLSLCSSFILSRSLFRSHSLCAFAIPTHIHSLSRLNRVLNPLSHIELKFSEKCLLITF